MMDLFNILSAGYIIYLLFYDVCKFINNKIRSRFQNNCINKHQLTALCILVNSITSYFHKN